MYVLSVNDVEDVFIQLYRDVEVLSTNVDVVYD